MHACTHAYIHMHMYMHMCTHTLTCMHMHTYRCVQLLPEDRALVAGCANGWVIWCDLRCGRYEKKMAHAECVNSVHVRGDKLVTAADDGMVRMTDGRIWAAVGSHMDSSTCTHAHAHGLIHMDSSTCTHPHGLIHMHLCMYACTCHMDSSTCTYACVRTYRCASPMLARGDL